MAQPERKSERKPYILTAVIAFSVIYLLAFGLLNMQSVHISFVAFSTDARLILVMLICAALGLVIGVGGTFLLARRGHRG